MTLQLVAKNRPSHQKGAQAAQDLFLCLLDRYVTDTALGFRIGGHLVTAGGRDAEGGAGKPAVVLNVANPRFFRRLITYGNLGIGESYIDQDFVVESGTLHDFLTALLRHGLDERVRGDLGLATRAVAIALANRLRGGERNVQKHYDIGEDLFESFLDSRLIYSCGYACNEDDDLEDAPGEQARPHLPEAAASPRRPPARYRLRVRRAACPRGEELRDRGVGITISHDHCRRGNDQIARHGLSGRIRIEFRDHRRIEGPFDKVVSVGMAEHLPRREYGRYFRNIARAMAPGALGLVHAIGCGTTRNTHDPFIQKYIFPGSGQPRLSEMARECERNRLAILDVENIVRHYAYTTMAWLAKFRQNRGGLDPDRYGPEFCRMWEYYLSCGIAAARASRAAVYQILFTNDHAAPRPLQRV